MASLFEAYDSTIKEAFTGIKIMLWAIAISIVLSPANFGTGLLAVIVWFMVFGFVITLAHNVIKKEPSVVPGLNIVQMAINGLMGCLATLPYVVVGSLIFWGYSSFVHIPVPLWDTTFRIVVGMMAAALPLTALCVFIRRMNIFEVFNISKVMLGYWEIFLGTSYFLLFSVAILALVYGFLYYVFNVFIGFENSFWNYINSCFIMVIIILMANAIAQISDEVYTFPEKEEEKKLEEQRIREIMAQEKNIKDMR